MKHPRHIGLALAALVVVGAVIGALVLASGQDQGPASAPAGEAPASPPAAAVTTGYRFEAGRVSTWSVEIAERAEVHVPRQDATPDVWRGDLALRARLQRVELGAEGSGWLVEVRLSDVQIERLTLSDQPLPVEARAFEGQSALARYDAEGRLLGVEVPVSASPVFANVVERLLQQSQAPWPTAPAERWERPVTGGFGATRWSAALHGCDAARGCEAVLTRQAADYTTLAFIPEALAATVTERRGQASLQLTLASTGQPAALAVEETLRLSHKDDLVADVFYRATWSLQGTHRLDPVARRAELERLAFAPVATGEAARLDALHKRVGGWTVAQALADLRAYGAGGQMPEHNRWVWRTIGLILLHPEAADQLAAQARAADTPPKARALILDVLGGAGTPEAQAAMRAVLGDDDLQSAPGYAALVQRFILVEAPEEASVALLESTWEDTSHPDDVRYGAAAALGAAISRTSRTDPDSAKRRAERLRGALASASDDTERRALIGALANTRQPAWVEDIAAHGESSDTRVRAAVANAMESLPDDGAVTYLIRVVATERDPQVQVVAVRALASHALRPDQLQALAAAVAQGPLVGRVVGYLVDTCMAFHRDGLDRDGIVAVLLAARGRALGDPAAADRVTVALQTVGFAG